MCTRCISLEFESSRNQAAYNDDKHPEDAKPYLNTNASQSDSGSVNESGLPNAQNVRYEGLSAR
jgi:hypothetical protein